MFRIKRNRTPSFPITICKRNLELASEYLRSLKYSGPVGLSCDNTKLHPSLRTYWDASKECHFLVGTTGAPIAVRDEGLLHDLVAESKKNAATKVMIIPNKWTPVKLICILPDPSLVSANSTAGDTTAYSGSESNPKQSQCSRAIATLSRSHSWFGAQQYQGCIICL